MNVRIPQNYNDSIGRPDLYSKMIVKYCKSISAFNQLSNQDQLVIFKSAVFDVTAIRFAFLYNPERGGHNMIESENGVDGLFFSLDLFYQLGQNDCVDFNKKICKELHGEMENDEKIRDLLSAKLLFKPQPELSNPEFIQYHESRYSRLFIRYLEFKYSHTRKASNKYSALMSLVSNFDLLKMYKTTLFKEVKLKNHLPHIFDEMFDLT